MQRVADEAARGRRLGPSGGVLVSLDAPLARRPHEEGLRRRGGGGGGRFARAHVDGVGQDPRQRRIAGPARHVRLDTIGARPVARPLERRPLGPGDHLTVAQQHHRGPRRTVRDGAQPHRPPDGERCALARHGPAGLDRERERRRSGHAVERRVDAAVSDGRDQGSGVALGIAGEGLSQLDAQGEGPEDRLVRRQLHVDQLVVGVGLPAEPHARVRVGGGEADHAAARAELVQAAQQKVRPIEERGDRFGRPQRILQDRGQEAPPPLVAPLRVGVEPLQRVNRRVPLVPAQLPLRGIRVGRDAEASQPRDVLDHVASLPSERVRRRRQAEGGVVAAGRADLHRLDAEHPADVPRRRRRAEGVPVVGQDHEPQARAGRGGGDLLHRAGAVGDLRMNVIGAAHDGRVAGRRRRHAERGGSRRQRDEGPCEPGEQDEQEQRQPAHHSFRYSRGWNWS